MIDEDTFGPADFETAFADEPLPRPATADLFRARRTVRRRRLAAGAVAAVAAGVAAVALVGPTTNRPLEAVPAGPTAAPASTPAPNGPAPSVSTSTASSSNEPQPSAGPDTAPPLRYRSGAPLDRDGRSLGDPRHQAFTATTRHTYDLVRLYLDPKRQHLGAYEADAFTGGGGGDFVQIGQKLSWKNAGQSGEGMLLVSVTRVAPGKKAVVAGSSGMGLCTGAFSADDLHCAEKTIRGHQVWYGKLSDGGFVIDFVQPDGEVASILVDPVFANNTTVPVSSMGISPSDAVYLLADRDLDVVG